MGYRRSNELRGAAVSRAIGELGSRQRVLDLGANDGWLSVRLAASGHEVVAVERCRTSRQVPPPRAPGRVEWVERAVTTPDLVDLGAFDVVVALSLLHHFRHPTGALRELGRMARTMMIVEVPDPVEARRPSRRSTWSELRGEVLSAPGARVLLWTPGWTPGSRRPLVALDPIASGRGARWRGSPPAVTGALGSP